MKKFRAILALVGCAGIIAVSHPSPVAAAPVEHSTFGHGCEARWHYTSGGLIIIDTVICPAPPR